MTTNFLDVIQEDFYFSPADLASMKITLQNCELHIDDHCAAALQYFGQGIISVYYFSVAKQERGKGEGMKKFLEILENKSPRVLVAITCHPAILKIFDNLNRSSNYRYTKDAKTIDRILAKMKEDEGEVGYLEELEEYFVWKEFYGDSIPQKDKNFVLPSPLQAGDALLLVLENTNQA